MGRYLICYIAAGNAVTLYKSAQNKHEAKKIVDDAKDRGLFVIDRGAEPRM